MHLTRQLSFAAISTLFGYVTCLASLEGTLLLSPSSTANVTDPIAVVVPTTFETDAFVQLSSTKNPSLVIRSRITNKGQFSFKDLPLDDHFVLSVHTRLARFQYYSIETTKDDIADVRLWNVQTLSQIPTKPFKQPLTIHSLGPIEYFESTKPFSLLLLLKNNLTIVMGLVAVAMMTLLPKLLAALDPETAAEVEKNQRDMHASLARMTGGGADLTSSLSKRLAGANAGMVEESKANAKKRR